MIVFLAARNVVRRSRRSFLIAGLIAAAVALLFFGNSILESTDAGLSRSFARSFTGELAVAAISSGSFGVFGDETPAIGEYTPLPVIREFPAVMEILCRFPEIERVTPLISGAAVVDLCGTRRAFPVFGIDASTYFQMFPRLTLIDGKFPAPGQAGALISSARAVEIETRTGRRPSPGDPVMLNMFGKRGFRIEEVPLAGIVEFEISNPLLESTVLVDAQTLRALLGLTLAAIIVIVNLLVIEVIERAPEIGTLRALGATKGFVRRLLLSETILLSLFGGFIGVLLGGVLMFLLRSIRLQLDNRLLQTLFGGATLKLTASPMIAMLSILTAIVIGLLSCVYPVHLALRVQPARTLSCE
jgi:ABC-type lipoprotein release transport system permease subunit